MAYFPDGLKKSATDRRGVTTLYSYDNLGRLRRTWLASAPFSGVPWSHETQYLDGPQPRRIEKDAKGQDDRLRLDGMGRVIKETDALSHYRTFAWDGVNKVEETDKRHFKTSYEYDGINRLVRGPPTRSGKTITVLYEDAREPA